MADDRKPWAFIAHRSGKWAGVISADSTASEVRKFVGGFAAKGCAIMTVYDRDEYNAALAARVK